MDIQRDTQSLDRVNDLTVQAANGEISPESAVRGLLDELRSIRAKLAPYREQLKPLEALEQDAVAAIKRIAERHHLTETFGDLRVVYVTPAPKDYYDPAEINRLIADLAATHPEIAGRLGQMRETKQVSAHAKIEPVKPGKAGRTQKR